MTDTRAAARGAHAALLKSNGLAVACGLNDDGQFGLPALAADLAYVHMLQLGTAPIKPPWPAAGTSLANAALLHWLRA